MNKTSFLFCVFVLFSNTVQANQVAQCLGTLVIDNSPVTAKIYKEGKIIIDTSFDTIQSTAKVETQSDKSGEKIVVSENDFQMFFSVSHELAASPVQAFRNGMFFVEDFYCIRVNQ